MPSTASTPRSPHSSTPTPTSTPLSPIPSTRLNAAPTPPLVTRQTMSTSYIHHHSYPSAPLAHPQPHRSYTTPTSPVFHHHHAVPSSSTQIPPTMPSLSHHSSYPSSACSSSHFPQTPKHSQSLSKSRPKPSKKLSSSTNKHKSVQVSLEVKVERAKGFHAFFVPLARAQPPAPPSSPVLGQRALPSHGGIMDGGADYFNGWDKRKVGRREQWVENVSGDESMEVDSE